MQKLPGFAKIKTLEKALFNHRIYGAVTGQQNMKLFMESHVFAVWDFMSLVKYLQRNLTCV